MKAKKTTTKRPTGKPKTKPVAPSKTTQSAKARTVKKIGG